jgi:hypothetical protein
MKIYTTNREEAREAVNYMIDMGCKNTYGFIGKCGGNTLYYTNRNGDIGNETQYKLAQPPEKDIIIWSEFKKNPNKISLWI